MHGGFWLREHFPFDTNWLWVDFSRYEKARLATFVNWPSHAPLPAEELAEAGFIYLGPGYKVQCAFCRGVLKYWFPHDSAMIAHRRHFPNCEFVQASTRNAARMPSSSTQHLNQRGHYEQQDGAEVNKEMPNHPEFATEASKHVSQNPQEMAGCGVICTGAVADDEERREKGQELIPGAERPLASQQSVDRDEKVSPGENNQTIVDPDVNSLKSQLEDLLMAKRCKVCWIKFLSSLFIPCGHLVCCGSCGLRLRMCPVCRGAILRRIPVRFANDQLPPDEELVPPESHGPSTLLYCIRGGPLYHVRFRI